MKTGGQVMSLAGHSHCPKCGGALNAEHYCILCGGHAAGLTHVTGYSSGSGPMVLSGEERIAALEKRVAELEGRL